jgi:hypothetical protein
MALSREQILAAAQVPANSFRLSLGDLQWVGRNHHLPAVTFARGLLARRFSDARNRFRSRHELAAAAIEIVKTNSDPFSRHELDAKERESFLEKRWDDPRDTLSEFRDLWRGYREAELQGTDPAVTCYEREVERLLHAMQAKTDALLAQSNATEGKRRLLQKNKARLASLATQVATAFRDTGEVRRSKLWFQTQLRRERDMLRFLRVQDDDYLLYKSRIKQCDPDDITFPLRHLGWLSVRAFNRLRQEWANNISRDRILAQLASEIHGPVFDQLLQVYCSFKDVLPVDRSSFLEELARAWEAECMLGVALIGITQTEGLIWDFAAYLRSKRARIYRVVYRRHYPYLWNFESGTFKHRRASGHGLDEWTRIGKSARALTSARQLLERTKLGSIIDEAVFSYLVDEFYDDRNKLAHGDVAGRNLQADAVGAILALRTCLEQLSSVIVSR